MAPGWDGEDAEPISHATANRAVEAADLMLAVAPEPFVAPAPTGALLLQWDFPDGRSVEVFIDADEHPPICAVVTTGDVIEEVPLSGLEQLRDVLERRAAAQPAR